MLSIRTWPPCSIAIGVLALACASPAPPTQPRGGSLSYPPARRANVVDRLHGTSVADPYRWLEDLGSAETRDWIAAQKALTRRWLQRVSTRERIGKEMLAAFDYERVSPPIKYGRRWFFWRSAGVQDQGVLHVAETRSGPSRPLLDVNQIVAGGKYAMTGVVISPRGNYVAYGLSLGGSDWREWRVREVATGRDLPDRLEWTKYYRPAWTADEKGLFYSAFPRPRAGEEITAKDLGCQVRLHRLGADGVDPVVHQRPDHPTLQFDIDVTDDGRWLVITSGDGQVGDRRREEIHVADLRGGRPDPVPLVKGFDAEYLYVTSQGSTFFLKTTNGAPNGRVIAVDANRTARSAWRTIVPAGRAVLRSASPAGGRLLVETLVDASSRLHLYGLDGGRKAEIDLPGIGTAFAHPTSSEQREAVYVYTSFDTPPTSYRHDLDTGRSEVIHRPRAVVDASQFESRQVFYRSKDGARIPLFLVHKKGLARSGRNPTFLSGYGGHASPTTPYYDPIHAWWLSIGGVLALPCLRGGDEFGEAWSKAAEKTRKQVTFDDFIAAAEWLIAEKITTPSRLAIQGASNGGLLVGAAVTQRPDLFGAAVVEAGVLDMLRFHLVGQGAGWQGIYGSPDVPEEFRALHAYSPVHNVEPGTRYPAIMVVTGENDSRVAPWHSYKFVAALQAAQTGPAPVLLELGTDAGHFGATTLTAQLRERADVYAFLLEVMDVGLR
jgi:prolyl oligopeptidase